MLTDNNTLYASVAVSRTKSTKVTITRAKSHKFIELAAASTRELVANATGYEPLFTNSSEGWMYQ